ncbi:MAG: BRO family protein [Cetobacterium sp.]
MTTNILSNQSPFDSIRREDADGEYWLARELMPLLGYLKWERFNDTVKRASKACENSQNVVAEHFFPIAGINPNSKKPYFDWRLSRYACYLIAMNGDPDKLEVAAAQSYFAIKTREAEVAIPALDLELEKLKLQNKSLELANRNLELQLAWGDRTDTRIALHGLNVALLLEGKSDAVVEVEKPTIEVIDDRHNVKFKGQTLVQVKEYLEKRSGKRFKSGAEVKRALERLGLGHLIGQTPRTVLGEYIPEENLDAAYQALLGSDRQVLLGE